MTVGGHGRRQILQGRGLLQGVRRVREISQVFSQGRVSAHVLIASLPSSLNGVPKSLKGVSNSRSAYLRYFFISLRAMLRLCTSSGPSARRRVRMCAHMLANGKSSVTPAPPWTWIARSMIFSAMAGATTLISAISFFATLLPCLSIMSAACSVSSLA